MSIKKHMSLFKTTMNDKNYFYATYRGIKYAKQWKKWVIIELIKIF